MDRVVKIPMIVNIFSSIYVILPIKQSFLWINMLSYLVINRCITLSIVYALEYISNNESKKLTSYSSNKQEIAISFAY